MWNDFVHIYFPPEEQEEIRSSAHLHQHKCLWQPVVDDCVRPAEISSGRKTDAPWRICESRRRTAAAPRWSLRRWCLPPLSPDGGTSRTELTMEQAFEGFFSSQNSFRQKASKNTMKSSPFWKKLNFFLFRHNREKSETLISKANSVFLSKSFLKTFCTCNLSYSLRTIQKWESYLLSLYRWLYIQ